MRSLYRLGVWAYRRALHAAAPFSAKARLWAAGRRNWRTTLPEQLAARRPGQPLFWMHCASLGEFEQGRPVLEVWRKRHPEQFVLLTFFSPSGFEIRKDYAHADAVAYLPADGARNARDFLDRVRPDRAVFVKYEFWFFYLDELRRRGVLTYLVSAVFRPGQLFFRPWGGFWRDLLGSFTQIFVQDERSETLLHSIQVTAVRTGDTRVDRVLDIAANARPLPQIERFVRGRPAFVIGSGWEADLRILERVVNHPRWAEHDWCIILAPHDVGASNVRRLASYFNSTPVLYSELTETSNATARVLLVDTVGLLSSMYQFARVAYVGGGFGTGLHNTLEPVAFGVPVFFGPQHEKFPEAVELLRLGAARRVGSAEEAELAIQDLAVLPFRAMAKRGIESFLTKNRGATERVLAYLERDTPEQT